MHLMIRRMFPRLASGFITSKFISPAIPTCSQPSRRGRTHIVIQSLALHLSQWMAGICPGTISTPANYSQSSIPAGSSSSNSTNCSWKYLEKKFQKVPKSKTWICHASIYMALSERWCCESAALNMPENLENSAVGTRLEKVSFHSNP